MADAGQGAGQGGVEGGLGPVDTGRGAGQVDVDRLIHEPARLAIMANLFVVESANATYLLQQTGLTWGNLGAHLAKLEGAGYLRMTKGYRGKQPQTTIELTAAGRAALLAYRRQLMATLDSIGGSRERT